MNLVQLENLSKTINGEMVLSNICMRMESGKIYGIVGKNGSGKSMLFRALADLIHLDEGRIYLNEQIVKNGLPRVLRMGLIIENVNLHMDLNAIENLMYLAKINGYITRTEVVGAIEKVGLDPDNKKKIKTYSLGMRQKLIIAQAIMEHPDILLLDEPTNALDEESVRRFYEIVKEEAGRGAIVMMASHNREDIVDLCDEAYSMKSGVLTKTVGEKV